jgi:hypothetical protein
MPEICEKQKQNKKNQDAIEIRKNLSKWTAVTESVLDTIYIFITYECNAIKCLDYPAVSNVAHGTQTDHYVNCRCRDMENRPTSFLVLQCLLLAFIPTTKTGMFHGSVHTYVTHTTLVSHIHHLSTPHALPTQKSANVYVFKHHLKPILLTTHSNTSWKHNANVEYSTLYVAREHGV